MNPEISGELPAAKPFEIRGHHMMNLLDYHSLGPNDFKDQCRQGVASHLTEHSGRTYFVDVYGTSMDDLYKAESGIGNFLKGFWELDDDSPVAFVTNRRDGLCKSCIFGEHCEKGITEDADVRTNDDVLLDRFIEAADKLGLSNDYLQRLEVTTTRTGGKLGSKVLATTAGVAREVIKSIEFQFAAEFETDKDRSTADKKWRQEERRVRRQDLLKNTEYQRAVGLHAVAITRPLVGVYCLYMAGSTIFTIGQIAQAVHDSDQTHRHDRAAIVDEANQKFGDMGKDVLEFLVSGVAYTAMPRLGGTRHRLQELRADRLAAINDRPEDN